MIFKQIKQRKNDQQSEKKRISKTTKTRINKEDMVTGKMSNGKGNIINF